MAIDLVALEAPLEPVRFPNGKEFRVVEFGPAEYELWQAVQGGDEAAAPELLRRCVPDAASEDLAILTPRMIAAIVGHAMRKLDLVLAALGNVQGGAATAPATPPSAPSATPSTPSPASRGRSASRSKHSGKSRSGAPSARSTRSRTSSGSTT